MEKMTTHDISRLVYGRIIGTLTDDERAELDRWIAENPENKSFVDEMISTANLERGWHMTKMVNTQRPARDMHRAIASMRRRNVAKKLAVAAAAGMVVAVGAYIVNNAGVMRDAMDAGPAMAEAQVLTIDEIKPGTSKARLSNSTGESLDLDAKGSGKTTFMLAVASSKPQAKPEELCLEVPRGGEFKIVLEDSTVVWLNSESTLRYPEVFTGDERRVEISGEAYFEVKKDEERPFYVDSYGQEIRVYGTSFNVKAYGDENITYTTLESGVISIRRSEGKGGEIMLSPGHQAKYVHDAETLDMKVVNTETITEWRHGRFVFEDQTLEEIMRDLSRWYDFEYQFADEATSSIVFLGSIPRYADFKTAITILEKCGSVEFAISDNKILISPSK